MKMRYTGEFPGSDMQDESFSAAVSQVVTTPKCVCVYVCRSVRVSEYVSLCPCVCVTCVSVCVCVRTLAWTEISVARRH